MTNQKKPIHEAIGVVLSKNQVQDVTRSNFGAEYFTVTKTTGNEVEVEMRESGKQFERNRTHLIGIDSRH